VSLARALDELREVVEKLSSEVERLKARKAPTSRTSSRPPSSDGPWVRKRERKKSSSRKQGGQPGQKPRGRELAPPEDVDKDQCVKPKACRSCSGPLSGDDPDPHRHQVIDIPPVVPQILEWQLHKLKCAICGTETRARLPEGVHASSFGPNLTALVCMLTGQYRMSRRNAQRFIADTYKIDISVGAISNMEGRMTEGLAAPHTEAMVSVANSATKHLDETSWRERGKGSWAWTAVGSEATVFVIRDTRGSVVAKELIGEEPEGFVITDRYSAYSFVSLEQRQVCLAHVIRDARRMSEGEKDLRWIGEQLLLIFDAIFRLWHLHRDEALDRKTLVRWTRPLRERTFRLLDAGARSRGGDTPSKCRGILETESALWTFLFEEGVEPTNNDAERALRALVIHRKTSFGSQSARGSRFIERIHTVKETLRRAGGSVHEFLLATAKNVLGGGRAPVLIPVVAETGQASSHS